MPSPDFSEYIDLTINDLQPEDVYNGAVEYARTALPEFDPLFSLERELRPGEGLEPEVIP